MALAIVVAALVIAGLTLANLLAAARLVHDILTSNKLYASNATGLLATCRSPPTTATRVTGCCGRCGVAIGVLVMLLAGLLAKRTAQTPPQPA